MNDVMERVQRGIEWLDSVKPEWRDLVDVGSLDMRDAGHCILGQVFEDEGIEDDLDLGYDYVLLNLAASEEHLEDLGFVHIGNLLTRGSNEGYARLDDAWVQVLTSTA